MGGFLFYGGIATAIVGAGAPLLLPGLPTALQTGPTSAAGSFIIDNQNWIVLVGLLMVLISVLVR